MHRTWVLIFVVLLAAPLAADDQWPQFRGPRGDGCSEATGLPLTWSETEHVRWKTRLPGRGWSSPVVWDNQVWLTWATEDGKDMSAVCLDQRTGQILYDLPIFHNPEPEFCHPLNSYASPTPAVEAGRVYLHFGSYGTACVETNTGRVLWTRRDLPCNHFRGPGSSPILFEHTLIVHFDGFDYQYLVALDKATGKTVWKVDRSYDFGNDDGDLKKAFSTPIIRELDGQRQLISLGSKAAFGYDPRTGQELWRTRHRAFSSTAMPFTGHGFVYVNTGFGKADLYAVRVGGRGDITDTHVAWVATQGIPSKPSLLLVGDEIYMVSDDGIASCLDAKTGTRIWSERVGGQYSASPLYADGRIYLFSHDGRTTVLAPGRTYQALAVNRLGDGFMASPAVTGSALLLRTKTHLYRIENAAP